MRFRDRSLHTMKRLKRKLTEPSSSARGAFYGLELGRISGWARDTTADLPMTVEIFAEGISLGTARADQTDARLPEGEPACAFSLTLSRPILGEPTLSIRGRIRETGTELEGQIVLGSAAEIAERAEPFRGAITGISAGAIIGWAVDRSSPDVRVQVELRRGTDVLGQVPASEIEPASQEMGGGHGFRLPLPLELFDGSVHSFRAFIGGTEFELKGSPIAIGLVGMDAIEERISGLEHSVRTIENSVRDINAQSETSIVALGSELMKRMDAIITVQSNGIERELSELRKQLTLEDGSELKGIRNQSPKSIHVVMDKNITGFGWHIPEVHPDQGAFRWMGQAATVVLDFTSDTPATILVRGPFVFDNAPLVRINVRVNGTPVTGELEREGASWLFEGRIPAAAFRGSIFSVVTFETTLTGSPGGEDQRTLSVAVSSVKLSRVQP